MIIADKDREAIRDRLKEMQGRVKLTNFTQELECQYCRETRQLVEELAGLSDKLEAEVYNFQIDKEKVQAYKVDKIPATVIEGAQDYGIRWYGIPLGYEFATLLEEILAVSVGQSGLSPDTKEKLAEVSGPLHLQVFVTPTCPHCPGAVSLAHRFAMESSWITADMVEATEFPHLSIRYSVRGVPRTVINEETFIEGAVPEDIFLEQVLGALRKYPKS